MGIDHAVVGVICAVVGWVFGGAKLYGDVRSQFTSIDARLTAVEKSTSGDPLIVDKLNDHETRLRILERIGTDVSSSLTRIEELLTKRLH